MCLSILAGLLLSSCVGQTAARAVSSREGPERITRDAEVDKRALTAAVLLPSLDTIYSTGDVTKRKTAGFGFNFQVDNGHGLWGFCPVDVAKVQDCLVGSCFDSFACSTGCGLVGQTAYSTITCSASRSAFCSSAFLTPQSNVKGSYTYLACGDEEGPDIYFGFTVDALPTTGSSTRTSTTSSASTSSTQTATGSQPNLTPGPSITPGPSQSSTASNSESSSGASQTITQPNSGGTTVSTGAIIGGAVGGLAVLCGFAVAIIWLVRRNKTTVAKSDSDSDAPMGYKPELEATERERAELFGRSLTEMSAQGPAAYDTSSRRIRYPPMSPVELPAAGDWK